VKLRHLAILVTLFGSLTAANAQRATQEAAFVGLFGFEIPVGADCTEDNVIVEPPPSTISGTFTACLTLTARDVQAEAGELTHLKAGNLIVLEDGFSVAAAASFIAELDPAIAEPFAYLQDGTPAAQPSYRASFYTNLDQLGLGLNDEVEHFVALDGADVAQFIIRIISDGLGHALTMAAREDNGNLTELPLAAKIPLASGWNAIELEWIADDVAGQLLVSVNGGASSGLTALDTGMRRIETVRWGAASGIIDASSGRILQDEFLSLQ
jgi:hypothetical protein